MGFLPKNNKPVASTPDGIVNGNNPGFVLKEEKTVKAPDELLTDKKFVINTQNNNTGVNMGRLRTVVNDLLGFAEGSVTKVTYYRDHYDETDTKGRQAEPDLERHNVHSSLLKINGFEMRMTGPLNYEHDADEGLSKLNGEAFTYPGFEPHEGDRFIVEVDTGKYALMHINALPVRTSIRSNTYFKVQFTMEEFLSEEGFAKLNSHVTDEAWFDKKRFLNESGALLMHDEYVEMKYLNAQVSKMLRFYRAKFLDETLMYSFMRPDGIYDPYVTDFLTKTLDYHETGHMAVQLFEQAPFIGTSIWTALMDQNTPYEAVPTSSDITTYKLGSKSVLANSLLNKRYVFFLKSSSLQDYLDALDKADAMYKLQRYPEDFPITSTTYELTKDLFFNRWKVYYKLVDNEYVEVGPQEASPNAPITPNTYYEAVYTYGFKPDTVYYTRGSSGYTPIEITEGMVPDPKVSYYLFVGEGGSGASQEGTIPADPNVVIPGEGSEDEEKTLGDLLLHLHPHYTECPLMSSGESGGTGGTTGPLTGLFFDGALDHTDLLRLFFKTREVDLTKLHACIEAVWKLDPLQQFYKMPIYVWLAKTALRAIHAEEGIFDRM